MITGNGHAGALSRPIRIAGAGPAGLGAALTLARAGHRVEVFERRDTVGSRFAGSLHGIENWTTEVDFLAELRAAGIAQTFDCAPFRELHVTDGRSMRVISSPRPLYYVVTRGHGPGAFERALLEQTLAAGGEIHLGTPAPADGVDILATGPEPGATFCVETGLRFRTSLGDLGAALVHPGAAPAGYAYLIVRAGVGCLCTVLFDRFREARSCLAEAEQILTRVFKLDVRDPEPTGGRGNFLVPGKFVDGAAARIGEAAGLQDALWGFGIRNSLACGVLAARASLGTRDWAREADLRFGRPARASVVNRLLWEYSATPAFSHFLTRLQRAPDPRRVLAAAYRGSWLHSLLFPFARARLVRRGAAALRPALTSAGSS